MRRFPFVVIILFVLLTVIAGCTVKNNTTKNSYIDVTPAEANDLISKNPDIIIIDVSPYYSQGHLPGSVSYGYADGSLTEAIPSLDKTKTYLVYCHSASVSIAASEKMIDAGFEKVYRLKGNYQGWVDAGYPVEY